jgi:hypothetical protein
LLLHVHVILIQSLKKVENSFATNDLSVQTKVIAVTLHYIHNKNKNFKDDLRLCFLGELH